MRFGCAAAYVLIAALGASCERQLEAPGPQCLHPCDLSQRLQITIAGGEKAASIVVTGACYGGLTDCGPSAGCASANASLQGGIGGSDTGEIVCHVVATAFDGRVAEADAVARYFGSSCCAGYEFRQPWVTLTFPAVDGGGGGGG